MSFILIAFQKEALSEKIRSVLVHSGFPDVRIVTGGMEALREMQEQNTGVLICPVRMRDCDYTAVLHDLPQFWDILLVDSAKNIAGRKEEDVMALSSPVTGHDLASTVDMMLGALDYTVRQEKKRRKGKPAPRSPEDQKAIDDAKAFLMDRNHMSEEEAFRYIQKNSMDMGRSMPETARMILSLAET